jgi:hypothetical protein
MSMCGRLPRPTCPKPTGSCGWLSAPSSQWGSVGFFGALTVHPSLWGRGIARRDAYHILLQRRFTADLIGVTMHRPDEPGYSRLDAYVIDDWW